MIDIEEYKEYEKMLAWRKLNAELEIGLHSGENGKWIPASEAKAHFKERYGE